MQFEYFNVKLRQNTALKIKQTVGAVTPPDGYAFGVLSALTNLETVSSDVIQDENSVYVWTLDVKIPTESAMVAYVDYVFEQQSVGRKNVIVKSQTMPTPNAELLGYEYQYMGETNSTYTHGYIYECVTGEPSYESIIGFEPTKIAFDYTRGDLAAFFGEITPNFPQITHGTFTYDIAGNIWTIVGKDADENVIFDNYRLYTEDLEDAGFVFINPPEDYHDGDVFDYSVNFTEIATYNWERIDVQPTSDGLPDQTDQGGKFLVTNGAEASWGTEITEPLTIRRSGRYDICITLYNGTLFGSIYMERDTNTFHFNRGLKVGGKILPTYSGFELGSSSLKWVLYATTINNGGAITIPTTAGTMAVQVSTLPTAASTNVGEIYQYIGATDSTYTNGHFYKCVSDGQDPATYSWEEVSLGGGGSIDAIDNSTITKNASDEIQAVATVNQNTASGATSPVFDWVGTLAQYQAQNIETLHPDWLCYITDDVSGGDSVYTKAQVDSLLALKVSTGHEVIEFQAPTADNNYTWYRKYADGWVEQGGMCSNSGSDEGSVTLPVQMADTTYTLVATNESTTAINGWGWVCVKVDTKTTTGFSLLSRQGTGNVAPLQASWQVSGMAA